MNKLFITAILLVASGQTFAVDWKPSAELGFVSASGNSDSSSLNGKIAAAGKSDQWLQEYYGTILRSEQNSALSANRYELGAKLARILSERSYLGGALRYEDDDFTAYASQASATINYGYWAIKNDKSTLQLEAGIGGRHYELVGNLGTNTEFIGRGFAEYKIKVSENARLFDTFLVETGSSNTFIQNDIGIEVSISNSLALKAAYQIRNNSDVLPGLEKTDTLTSINLVWAPKQ